MLDETDPARGAAIAALRTARPMTQAALAGAAGLHVSTVKKAEAGRPLSAETAAALCAVLGVAPGAFVAPGWGLAAPAEPAAPDASSGTRAGPAPVPRAEVRGGWGRRVAVWAAVTAVGCEIAAWTVTVENVQTFRLWQASTQWFLGIAAVALAARALAASTGRSQRAVATQTAILVLAIAFLAWVPARTNRDLGLTAADVAKAYETFGEVSHVIRVRHAIEPGWDPTLARWSEIQWLQRVVGADATKGETPGHYAWRVANLGTCREMYLHAPTYDPAPCTPPAWHVADDRSLANLWRSIVGGSWLVVDDRTLAGRDMREVDVVDGDDFAEARAVVAEGLSPREEEARTRALAAAQRDRAGPAG